MVASAAATDGANEHAAEATARRAGGLLVVHGIQSQTVGLELAWGRTPVEVPCIFFIFLIFAFIFYIYYLLAYK